MNRADQIKRIEEKVAEIIRKELIIGREKITASTSLVDDLGASSLNLIEIFRELEEHYILEIHEEDVEKMATVESIVQYITKMTIPKNVL